MTHLLNLYCPPAEVSILYLQSAWWSFQGCHLLLVPGASANVTVTGPKKEKKVHLLCQLCKTQRSFLLQVWGFCSTIHLWFNEREQNKLYFCRRKDLQKKDSERLKLELPQRIWNLVKTLASLQNQPWQLPQIEFVSLKNIWLQKFSEWPQSVSLR